jgi:hypothetical protein
MFPLVESPQPTVRSIDDVDGDLGGGNRLASVINNSARQSGRLTSGSCGKQAEETKTYRQFK